MPDAYEAARQRILARRAAGSPGVVGSVVGSVGEAAKGFGSSIYGALRASNPITAGMDMFTSQSGKRPWNSGYLDDMEKDARERMSGLKDKPIQGVTDMVGLPGTELAEGNYSRAAGKGLGFLAMGALGAKAMGGPRPAAAPEIPSPYSVTSTALKTGAPTKPLSATGPSTLATTTGSWPSVTQRALIPTNMDRFDPRPSAYSGLRDLGTVGEVGEQVRGGVQNDFKGPVGFQREPPPELPPVGPFNPMRNEGIDTSPAIPKTATPTPMPDSRLRKNFPGNKAVEETTKQASNPRPFGKVRDVDLETLAKTGNPEAIKEAALRKRVAERGKSPEATAPKTAAEAIARIEKQTAELATQIEEQKAALRAARTVPEAKNAMKSPRRGLLEDETGAVNFSAGIAKAKGQLGSAAKKIPGIIGDAQRAALLTGIAVPKSALGAVGGLGAELAERALTQAPGKTVSDLGKVASSIPGGLKRAGKEAMGTHVGGAANRHLSDPGMLSKPAIRAMATMDAPFREALESLGLTQDEALQRILNASPKSQTGKDLVAFLSKHPIVKGVVAPVGAVTSTNVLEQGALRTPGVNLLKSVSKMDPHGTPGKTAARTALGAGAGYAGYKAGENLDDNQYLMKGLLASIAGPYALPVGLGMAFSSKDSLSKALDSLGSSVGRELPVRMPGPNTKISTEVERRFTPSIVKELMPEKKSNRRKTRRQNR